MPVFGMTGRFLVTLADDNKHLEIDYDESEELPDDTCSHEFYESGRHHCRKVLIVRFDVFFYSLHISLLIIIQGSKSSPA